MDNDDNKTLSSLECVLHSAYKFFQDLDKNGNGYIEKDELMIFMKDCDIPASEDECIKFLMELDKNGDGVWDFAEFMTFLGMTYSSVLIHEEKRATGKQK